MFATGTIGFDSAGEAWVTPDHCPRDPLPIAAADLPRGAAAGDRVAYLVRADDWCLAFRAVEVRRIIGAG